MSTQESVSVSGLWSKFCLSQEENVTLYTLGRGSTYTNIYRHSSGYVVFCVSWASMSGHSRLHVEEVFACLRVRWFEGRPLVRALVVCPSGSAPCRLTGRRGACWTGWCGGALTVDQPHLFWVGDSHRLREGHRDVTVWQGEREKRDACQYWWNSERQWPVGNHWAASGKRKTSLWKLLLWRNKPCLIHNITNWIFCPNRSKERKWRE